MSVSGQPDEASRERDDERDAFLALAVASRADEGERRELLREHHDVELPSLGEALETLTALTAEDTRRSQRTFSLQLLVKAMRRRGFEAVMEEAGPQVEAYLTALLDETRRRFPDRPDLKDPLGDLLGALRATALDDGQAWAVFASSAQEPLQLRSAEVALPLCSDEEAVIVDGIVATRTVVWFWSERPAADFANWTDPRRWHTDCSLFFEDMSTTDSIPADAEEFTATFTEVIRIDQNTVLTTPLVFTRYNAAPGLYGVEYALPPGVHTADLLVDEGELVAREDDNRPPEQRTELTAEKIVRFVDPALATWPTLLCDLFWMELTITVALGCAQDDN